MNDLEQSLSNCLQKLERYETEFAAILRTSAVSSQPSLMIRPAANADIWQAKLRDAESRTQAIEAAIQTQQQAYQHWLKAFTAWQERVEQWETLA
jgi:hypothetical protein